MTKIIVVASNNMGKLKEISDILPGYDLITLQQAGIVSNPEENGRDFSQNALIKAREVKKYTDYTVIADDSGLEVFCLNGLPGIYSKRFYEYLNNKSTEKLTDTQIDQYNIDTLLCMIGRVDKKIVDARFVCKIALIEQNGKETLFSGHCYGGISKQQAGTRGFGYDPVFIPEGYDTTFSLMSDNDKNLISHRGLALKKMKEYLDE